MVRVYDPRVVRGVKSTRAVDNPVIKTPVTVTDPLKPLSETSGGVNVAGSIVRLKVTSTFTGGVNVATADITRDKYPDLIVGPGLGGGPRVRVLDGKTGEQIPGPLGGFWAYDPAFRGGVEVAAGDVNGDGIPDVITAAGYGGGPHIKVFDGKTGAVIQSFFAYDPDFRGGVSVAAADFTGDGKVEIAVGAGLGGGPHVKVFNAMTGQTIPGPLGNFFAFDPDSRGGVNVGTDAFTGDVTGDGRMDLLVGAGVGMSPRVKVYDGVSGQVAKDFLAFDPGMTAGVRPAAAYVTDDKYADIVVATGKGVESKVRVFDGRTGVQLPGAQGEYLPFGAGSLRGVNLAASNDPLLSPDHYMYTNPTSAPVVGVGQPFFVTAELGRGSTTDPYPTGDITFSQNGVTLGTATLAPFSDLRTKASLFVAGGGVGKYASTTTKLDDIRTSYPGDANYFATATAGELLVTGVATNAAACDPVKKAGVASGETIPTPRRTAGGVGLDGSFGLSQTDLVGGALDLGLSQAWSWSSAAWRTDGQAGAGSSSGLSMRLVPNNGNQSVYAADGGTGVTAFDQWPVDATTAILITDPYHARYGSQAKLTHDITNQRFTLTDGVGNTFVFYDFSVGSARGQLKSMTDAAGNVVTVNGWDTAGYVTSVSRVTGSGATAVTETLNYSTVGNAVTLTRAVGTGSPVTVRSVSYDYPSGYGTSVKTLRRATVTDAATNTIDTSYFRYYPASGPQNPSNSALKYAFGPVSYARLAAYATSLATSVDALSDAQVAPYADHYLEYGALPDTPPDVMVVVTKHVVGGGGCSICSGGQGTYTYQYATNANGFVALPNVWAFKLIETAPDGTVNRYYTNRAGEVILHETVDGITGISRINYTRYNDNWQPIFLASPAAMIGYNELSAGLMYYEFGVDSNFVRNTQGLVTTISYDKYGFLTGTAIQNGEFGSSVPQSLVTYTTSPNGYFFPASTTQYRNTDGTGAETTTASYTWQGSTARIGSITITAPTVTTGQNGPNAATSTTTVMDPFGRPIWSKDAAGFITYAEYDPATGAAVKRIADVDTTQTSTFTGLQSGWSTPSGGGLHLTTSYEVDTLGRVTKRTAPNGRVDYTVYNDANHEVRTYPAWNSGTNTPTGPITVSRDDRANGYRESLTMSATPTASGGRPTGTESIANVESLSRTYRNIAGQNVYTDDYFNLSGLTYSTSPSLGTLNTNFYRTYQDYNQQGQPNRSVTPAGTITRTEYDGSNRPLSVWVGTDDIPTTGYWSTTNLTGTDMVKVTAYEYDGGGSGNGDLTQVTEFPSGGAANRVTQAFYDWRDRVVAVKAGVETTESTSVNRPIRYWNYDNLDEVTKSRQFDGDGVTVTTTSGVPDAPSASLLRAQSTIAYDERGQAYLSQMYSVDPATGTVGANTLKENAWYDSRGNLIKVSSPGGLVQKTKYDGAWRETVQYVTDGGGDTAYADASTVTGDVVLSQWEATYDANSNVILTTNRDRFHDETATGALGTPSTSPKARVSYATAYYDLADRPTDVVDVGTNGGSAYTRPSSVPTRSDTALVSSASYDSAGRLYEITDPRGLKARTYYDALDRPTKTIQNYVDGTPSNLDDKTTEYAYGPAGMTSLTARLTGGGGQTTAWVYGVTTAAGSGINSNDVASVTQWPDPSTGAASSSQQDTATVNALGELLTATDRNGSTHALTYDVVGRVTDDAVTTLGTNVDGAVRRLHADYDGQGNPYLLTSYSAASGGSVVNQVQRAFNGLGQLTTEYQAHGAAVNTATTPKVQYAYAEMGGGANQSRPTSMTYPNGRVLTDDYGTSGGLNDSISRLSALKDGSTTLEGYSFLGLATVVTRTHPEPGVDLTYVKLSGESNGDGGDQYTGLDRFGRVVDQRWVVASSGVAVDRFGYAYDRDSNPLTKTNGVNSAFSESYTYDGLNQLASFARGSHTQAWGYDSQGNWDSVTADGTAQTRSHNKQNEITAVSGATSPTYDASGNLTKDETGRQFVYDAWNRLVKVKDSGGTVLETLGYDALNQRVSVTTSTATTDLYYSADWQVLEVRVGGVAAKQYMWSPVGVDVLIERDRDTDANGTLDERLYVLQDASNNVTALVNTSGTVVERFVYDPFGQATVLDASWGARSGSAYDWTVLWQGEHWDSVSGLYLMRDGDYSPTLGRTVTTGTLEFWTNGGDHAWFGGNQQDNNVELVLFMMPEPPNQEDQREWMRRQRDLRSQCKPYDKLLEIREKEQAELNKQHPDVWMRGKPPVSDTPSAPKLTDAEKRLKDAEKAYRHKQSTLGGVREQDKSPLEKEIDRQDEQAFLGGAAVILTVNPYARALKGLWNGGRWLFENLSGPKSPTFPGRDGSKAPPGFEWKGKSGSTPGSKDGNWHNPKTGETLRPDLDHPKPIGPHWDYRGADGKWWRIFPDGRMEAK